MLLNIDYTVVILGILLLLGVVNWFFHARNHYDGPNIELLGGSGSESNDVPTVFHSSSQHSKVIEEQVY